MVRTTILVSGGFASGAVASGNLKGGVLGAFQAAVNVQIGDTFADLAKAGKFTSGELYAMHTLTHAVSGGVFSTLGGGKFGHGFVAAGVATAFSPVIDGISNPNGRVVVAALIGGAASRIAGGKFGNGALTAAFAQAFNGNQHTEKMNGRGSKEDQKRINLEKIADLNVWLKKEYPFVFTKDIIFTGNEPTNAESEWHSTGIDFPTRFLNGGAEYNEYYWDYVLIHEMTHDWVNSRIGAVLYIGHELITGTPPISGSQWPYGKSHQWIDNTASAIRDYRFDPDKYSKPEISVKAYYRALQE